MAGKPALDKGPASLISLLPDAPRELLNGHLSSNPEIFKMGEEQLTACMVKREIRMGSGDYRLRTALWKAVARLNVHNPNIKISTLVEKSTDRMIFYRLIECPYRSAWLFIPPANYEEAMEELLARGIEELRDVIVTPHRDPTTGLINTKLVDLKIKAIAMVDQRLKGAYTQRVEQKTMQLNVNQTQNLDDLSMKDIDSRLKQLQQMATEAQNLPLGNPGSLLEPPPAPRGSEE